MSVRGRLAAASLGTRLAVAFAAVALGTALAVAVATPTIVGRGFAAMQAQETLGASASSGTEFGPGRGAGQGGGMGPGAGGSPGAGAYLAQAQQDTTNTIVGVAIGAAAIASIIGLVIARGVARPLRRLEAAAAAVARGDLRARSGVADRADEIGYLGRSFDAMASDLERSEAARRRFFQDAAHEMKTPLAVIEATTAAVLDGVYEHDDRHLSAIRDQARLLGRVVDDLRTISLAETGALPLRLEPVALAPLLVGIREAFAARAEAAGVALLVGDPTNAWEPTVRADRDRVAQAVGALVDNAIRHSPPGGHVILSAEPASPARASGGLSAVRITVADEGPGIATDDLTHVFDRFFQADPSRDRTTATSGLGLAIVRAVLEAHGGAAGVENRPEGGARFWLDLPGTAAS